MAMAILIFTVTLPLMVKFGSEKGRVALFAVFAVIGAMVAFIVKSLENAGNNLNELLLWLEEMPVGNIVFVGVVVLLVIVFASYLIAIRIMNKKEY